MKYATLLILSLLGSDAASSEPPDPGPELEKAVERDSRRLEERPEDPGLWNQRGSALFMLGRIEESIRDFDEAIRLRPESEPYHWQRGISYYYAGRYGDGRRQFESHRKVNPHDVENAAWHFFCAARERGLAWARERLIPIETSKDTRVPMREIYLLLHGRATPDEVLAAAGPDRPSDRLSRQQHNYAHLYLGLWYEVNGKAALARHHLDLAAGRYRMENYMGYVSVVHTR